MTSSDLQRARYIYSSCACLAAQRAARALARRFDEAFRPEGITNGQFSLLVALSAGLDLAPSELAVRLSMDRATVSSALKRRGLVEVGPDERDKRRRLVRLTPEGRAVVERLVPIWIEEHAAIDRALRTAGGLEPDLAWRVLDELAAVGAVDRGRQREP